MTTPASVTAGQTELLFVSTSVANAAGTPTGWTKVTTQTSSPLQTTVYRRTTAGADAGATVTVPMSTATAAALQLAVYSAVDGSSITATGLSDSATGAHVAPAAPVNTAGSWVVSAWADKSSTTTSWNVPAAVTSRDVTIGTGSGRVAAALGDSGQAVSTGTYPARTATTNAAGTKGLGVTVILSPSTQGPNQKPVAAASATCTLLHCAFDGSGSADADGSIDSYAWDFGDGSTGTGVKPTHDYATAGTYQATLVVTDNRGGASPATAVPVTVTAPVTKTIGFVGTAHSYSTGTTSAAVVTPAAVSAGDTQLLFVTTALADVAVTPTGWTKVTTQTSSPLQATVFRRTAVASDAGATVTVSLSATSAIALQLLDYQNVVATGIVVTGASDSATASHSAPATTVGAAGSYVLSFWSDKSSTTTGWTVPGSTTSRDVVVGTGGGRVKGAMLTLVLPAGN